ncbi:MAG: nickel-responsive transcriptional regulator NikR [Bacillota bacterium]
MSDLVRFGVSMDKSLLTEFDRLIEGKYANRSEAVRDLVRDKLVKHEWDKGEEVAGSLTLLYDHHHKGLTEKMLAIQHDNHDIFCSTLHQHLSHDTCLEVIIVRGRSDKVRDAADRLLGLKGVKHGKLSISSTGDLL